MKVLSDVLHTASILLREQNQFVQQLFKNHQNVPNMFIDISKNIQELSKNIQELSKNNQELSKNIQEFSKLCSKKKNLQTGP